jgi:pleckstrin domain-containing family G protein 5
VEDFFTPEELQPCRDSISEMVDNLADKLYQAGKITGDIGFHKEVNTPLIYYNP